MTATDARKTTVSLPSTIPARLAGVTSRFSMVCRSFSPTVASRIKPIPPPISHDVTASGKKIVASRPGPPLSSPLSTTPTDRDVRRVPSLIRIGSSQSRVRP